MHEGCSGSFQDGKMVVDKLRKMGFTDMVMPAKTMINCSECGDEFEMTHLESKCPNCGMVYGVTPCSTQDPSKIMAAGKDY